MVTFPIVSLSDNDVADAAWFEDITDAVNDFQSRLLVVESFNARIIRKATETQAVNNSTTLVNDSHLLVAVEANTNYAVETNVFFSSGATPDIKFAFTYPALSVFSWMGIGYLDTSITFQINMTSSAYQSASGTTQSYGGGGDFPTAQLKGFLRVGATAGNLQLQWAQNTANASNTLVKQDSWMKIEKVVG